jgi:hypothetical protein
MDTRKVEVLEEKILDGEVTYYRGDIKSFPKPKADDWVRFGWAKDVDTGESNERVPGSNGPVSPDNVTVTSR